MRISFYRLSSEASFAPNEWHIIKNILLHNGAIPAQNKVFFKLANKCRKKRGCCFPGCWAMAEFCSLLVERWNVSGAEHHGMGGGQVWSCVLSCIWGSVYVHVEPLNREETENGGVHLIKKYGNYQSCLHFWRFLSLLRNFGNIYPGQTVQQTKQVFSTCRTHHVIIKQPSWPTKTCQKKLNLCGQCLFVQMSNMLIYT